MFIIIKEMKNKKTGNKLPVILLDSQAEVLEFESKQEASNLCNILNTNTDSGHIYSVKSIGKNN